MTFRPRLSRVLLHRIRNPAYKTSCAKRRRRVLAGLSKMVTPAL